MTYLILIVYFVYFLWFGIFPLQYRYLIQPVIFRHYPRDFKHATRKLLIFICLNFCDWSLMIFIIVQQDTWRNEYKRLVKVLLNEIIRRLQVKSWQQVNNKEYLL